MAWKIQVVVRHLHKELWAFRFSSYHWCIHQQKWPHISTCWTVNLSHVSIPTIVCFDPADTYLVIFFTFGKRGPSRLHYCVPPSLPDNEHHNFLCGCWHSELIPYSGRELEHMHSTCIWLWLPWYVQSYEVRTHSWSCTCAWSCNVGVQGRASTCLMSLWAASWCLYFTYNDRLLQCSSVS